MKRWRAHLGVAGVVVACVVAVALAGCQREPGTPEARRQRGDELVRKMSERLAAASAFTFSTSEVYDIVVDGKRVQRRFSRTVAVRRPDRAWFELSGVEQALTGW